MKTKPFILALTVSVLALAPRLHSQQPAEDSAVVHTPAASPTPEPDVFDALKKGISKVQKQTREAKELEPEVKALKHRQDELEQELTEGKERLHTVLLHQSEEIKSLTAAVARLETELKTLRAAAPASLATPASTPGQP